MLLVVVVDPSAATSATTGLVFSSNTDVDTVAPGTKAPPGAMALSSGQYSVKAEMMTRGGTSFTATAVYANGNPPPPPTLPPPSNVSSNIADYIALAGDQTVVVPDGTYSVPTTGTVVAPHAATGGRYGGWLVLVAQHQDGAVVDMQGHDLVLDAATSRVLFVGFRFTNGSVYTRGSNIDYWYCDQTYPDYSVITSNATVPRFLYISGTSDGVYGGDFHDGNASVLVFSYATNTVIEGVHIWNVYEHAGTDPHDYSHTNDISILNGNITNLTIADSYLTGNRGNHQAVTGDITGLDYDNVWWTGAEGTAFQFASYNGYHVFGSRTNVRSFDQAGRNPNDRLDLVNGQQLTGANSMPSLVDVIDTGVSLQAPPAGTPDPATVWRQNHPYSSWTQFFGWS